MNFTNRKSNILIGILIMGTVLGGPDSSAAQKPELSLGEFLNQVRAKNDGVKGAAQNVEGAQLRASDANLMYSPRFDINVNMVDDQKAMLFLPVITGTVTNNYSTGFSKLFSSGTQAKLNYTMSFQRFVNAPLNPTSPFNTAEGVYIGTPQLELKQPLWRNGFGRETRATFAIQESDALAKHFEESFRLKSALADAETVYWRLALTREAKSVQTAALERARKIYEWNVKRASLQLADRADELQAEALLEVRRLELQSAIDEERSARLVFNQARGIANEDVPESLIKLDKESDADALIPPKREGLRDDVKAAQQRERQAVANSQIGAERSKPIFEVFGSYAFNAQQSQMNDAISKSFEGNLPTRVIGLNLSVPLAFGSASDTRAGYQKEQLAAELNTQKRVFDQDRDWADLNIRFNEAKKRLDLAQAIETAQEKKLKYERDRLTRGRSTTFQVLQFEQDFATSQLSRIRAQADILNIVSRMKVFTSGGNSL